MEDLKARYYHIAKKIINVYFICFNFYFNIKKKKKLRGEK